MAPATPAMVRDAFVNPPHARGTLRPPLSDFPDPSARGSPTGRPSPCWQPVRAGNVQRRKVIHVHGVRRDSEPASASTATGLLFAAAIASARALCFAPRAFVASKNEGPARRPALPPLPRAIMAASSTRRLPSCPFLPCLRAMIRAAIGPCPRWNHVQRAVQPVAANVETTDSRVAVAPSRRSPRCGQRLHYAFGKSVHHAALDVRSRRLSASPPLMPSTCLSM